MVIVLIILIIVSLVVGYGSYRGVLESCSDDKEIRCVESIKFPIIFMWMRYQYCIKKLKDEIKNDDDKIIILFSTFFKGKKQATGASIYCEYILNLGNEDDIDIYDDSSNIWDKQK